MIGSVVLWRSFPEFHFFSKKKTRYFTLSKKNFFRKSAKTHKIRLEYNEKEMQWYLQIREKEKKKNKTRKNEEKIVYKKTWEKAEIKSKTKKKHIKTKNKKNEKNKQKTEKCKQHFWRKKNP